MNYRPAAVRMLMCVRLLCACSCACVGTTDVFFYRSCPDMGSRNTWDQWSSRKSLSTFSNGHLNSYISVLSTWETSQFPSSRRRWGCPHFTEHREVKSPTQSRTAGLVGGLLERQFTRIHLVLQNWPNSQELFPKGARMWPLTAARPAWASRPGDL